jgi:hypothetical protein
VKLTLLLHRVHALGQEVLDRHVADIVDDVGVVAAVALHPVGAGCRRSGCWPAPLPVSLLAMALPVPLMVAVPVRKRVSRLVPERVADAAPHRVDPTAALVSDTVSPTLSTT